MNQSEAVKVQYADDKNLSIRMQLHAKYSTNRQGLYPWLFERYEIKENDAILELGCGNGAQWQGRRLPNGCKLILSDFSQDMLRAAREKNSLNGAEFQIIDVQNIPFEAEMFDIIIANFMLYHVPNLAKALSEARRILKPGGRFYAATLGTNGQHEYMRCAIQQFYPQSECFAETFSFTLQNGGELLNNYFSSVKRLEFEDALAVTNTCDLIDWLKSTMYFANGTLDGPMLAQLYGYFEAVRIRDGAIRIPKESGVFISVK